MAVRVKLFMAGSWCWSRVPDGTVISLETAVGIGTAFACVFV